MTDQSEAGPSSHSQSNLAKSLVAELLEPTRSARKSSLGSRPHPFSASETFQSRIDGRKFQLGNPDRPRPKAERGSVAARKLKRREDRLVKRAKRSGQGSLPVKSKDARRALSRSERRQLGLDVRNEQPSYESLLPTHSLWTQYIQSLLQLVDAQGRLNAASFTNLNNTAEEPLMVKDTAIGLMQQNLTKAELAGGLVRVSRSANPALVGLSGIIARETEQTIVIVPPLPAPANGKPFRRPKRTTKVIPKHATDFVLSVPLPNTANSEAASGDSQSRTLDFTLHGSQLRYTLPTRATRKWKHRRVDEL
ncbi:RNase MRP and P, subunit POP4/p29 [Ceraceosorus bombacis]|uniref:RNase MRP and P, subunit POP4/p29 n=1 Tax=Ceraceosorus bombacis TaxID=401625 RepID=A0A0N7LB83_9BASI|nr:RNase MRP and P, subunit POP4/p29 [Ceraceosorus bombacis]